MVETIPTSLVRIITVGLMMGILFTCSSCSDSKNVSDPPNGSFDPAKVTAFTITDPQNGDTLVFGNETKFEARGISAGVQEQDGAAIYLLVYPDYPEGAGWYVQHPPASIEPASGDWFAICQLGGQGNYIPRTGDAFFIKAFATDERDKMDQWDLLSSDNAAQLKGKFVSTTTVSLFVKIE